MGVTGIGIGVGVGPFSNGTGGAAAAAAEFIQITGSAGGYASAPDSAALDLAGDFDIRVAVAPTSWSGATRALISKGSSSAVGYGIYITSGAGIIVFWRGAVYLNESFFTSAPGYSDGQLVLFRATLDIDNGAGGYTGTLYAKTGVAVADVPAELLSDTGWSSLNSSTVSTSGAETALAQTNDAFAIGAFSAGASPCAGKFYGAVVKDGIAGTLVFDGDPTVAPVGDSSFTESSSNAATVTLNGDASLAAA